MKKLLVIFALIIVGIVLVPTSWWEWFDSLAWYWYLVLCYPIIFLITWSFCRAAGDADRQMEDYWKSRGR